MDEDVITMIVEEVEEQLEGRHPKWRQSIIGEAIAQLVNDFGYDTHHQEEIEEARRRLKI